MKLDQWMTDFYNQSWYRITEPVSGPLYHPGLYEWRIAPANHEHLREAHSKGFELVETMVEFVTKVSPVEKEYTGIRLARPEDIQAIYDITYERYILNKKFYTRFKNPNYFTLTDAYRYYKLTISNYFNNPDCYTSVVEINGKVVGYYMLLDTKEDNLFRGIMTGILPEAIGKGYHIKMQHFLFNIIGKDIYTLNKTQLNNFNTINNHIKEKRVLKNIEHIFYKKVD